MPAATANEVKNAEAFVPTQQAPLNRSCKAENAASRPDKELPEVIDCNAVQASTASVETTSPPTQQGPWNRLCRATGAATPSGGSVLHEVKSVGANILVA